MVQQVVHHLVAVAARSSRNRLRSRRPGRGGAGRRGQVGHGGGEGQLRQGRPEVRGGLKGQMTIILFRILALPCMK